jgi:ElaB/YqjD/DUF883 family membrane-anchored ribosome-binding protein
MEPTPKEVTREQLIADIGGVLSDAETLLREAAAATGDRAVELRRRAEDAISGVVKKLGRVEQRVVTGAKDVAIATDDWVHKHPWRAVGIGAGVGLLIGLLINRR